MKSHRLKAQFATAASPMRGLALGFSVRVCAQIHTTVHVNWTMKSVKLSSSSLYLAICFHDSIAPTKCSSVRQIFQFAACKWQLPTPWYGHWTRVSFAFLPWSWINSRPCAGNPCAGGSSLDDAAPRGGGPETLCELPGDAELLLLLGEFLARGSLFAKPLH